MDTDWRLISVLMGGAVLAAKNGRHRVFAAGSYSLVGPSHTGARLTVWLSRGSMVDQAGFFYLHPLDVGSPWESDKIARLYWNLQASESPDLLSLLGRRLDRFAVPYMLKTLSDAAAYSSRNDGTVLFFQRQHFQLVVRLCLEVHKRVLADPRLEPRETPLFALPLANGLAFAEDPGTSFGLSRCQTLAEALWNAHALGQDHTVGGQMDEIRRHFRRRGLSLATPYLNPGSADLYSLPCIEEGP